MTLRRFIRTSKESLTLSMSLSQKSDMMGECQVEPTEEMVSMGSALHGWGFSLTNFAKITQMLQRLWGNNFVNITPTNKYTKDHEKNKPMQFILEEGNIN